MRVRLKQSIASPGTQTIGSFSLKLVFKITGMPVRSIKRLNQIVVQRILFPADGLKPARVVHVIDGAKFWRAFLDESCTRAA